MSAWMIALDAETSVRSAALVDYKWGALQTILTSHWRTRLTISGRLISSTNKRGLENPNLLK